jgi:hypothetical protein
MSSKYGFFGRWTVLPAAIGVAALVCAAAPLRPARADGWKHHHGWHGGGDDDDQGDGYYAPGNVYYPPPPVVYYAPRPVYVAPPPPVVYQAPAPVYYGPPILSFGITVPLK